MLFTLNIRISTQSFDKAAPLAVKGRRRFSLLTNNPTPMGSAFQKERGIVGGNGAIEGFVTAFDLTKAFSSNLKLKFFEPIL